MSELVPARVGRQPLRPSPSRRAWLNILGALGGLVALLSITLPWFRVGSLSFSLLSLQLYKPFEPVCVQGSCFVAYDVELLPSLLARVPFACTIIGGTLGVASTAAHRLSVRACFWTTVLGMGSIIVAVLFSLSNAILSQGLSTGFYTDGFSAVFYALHIFSHYRST